MLGAFSLVEATTQQIRSVYSSRSVFEASVLDDEEPPQQLQAELSVPDMDAEEFKRYDVFELSQVDKPLSDRQCISCATPYKYGSDFCDTCRQYKKNTWFCGICDAPTQESWARKGICRGHAVSLCTPPAGKTRTFRTTASADDIKRAVLRSERLAELKQLRSTESPSAPPRPPQGKGKGGKGRNGQRRDGRGDGGAVRGMGAPGGGPGQAHFVGALFPTSGGAAAPEDLPAPFAADVRVACLQSQSTPLLSIHDLDRSFKQQGGYAKVQWGDSSSLTVCDGSAVVDIPLERDGAYIRLRGNTDFMKTFVIDPREQSASS